ncbi:MAG: hypothetical protein K2M10_08255 [Muribaculaceae bacterium]|nr:hypothetical protein [Muribaculaceae bacterium]MDE6299618.1 hypothetical protein [Muribaculaceae bacterium]
MTKESIVVLRAEKVADIIISISELYAISLEEAADMYYGSQTADLIEEGVAELHCRSSKYLATLIWDEAHEKQEVYL